MPLAKLDRNLLFSQKQNQHKQRLQNIPKIMFKYTTALAFFAMIGTSSAQFRGPGGPRGGPRGGGGSFGGFAGETPTVEALVCDETEQFACGSRRLGDVAGILACRNFSFPEGDKQKVVCVNPDEAFEGDQCGCCEEECPTSCPEVCGDADDGYWITPNKPPRGRFGDNDGVGEEEVIDPVDAQVVICAPQLKALTAVASGKATCYTGDDL